MPKRYHITAEQKEELNQARKVNKNKNVDRRIRAILLHGDGEKHKIIAEKTGFSKTYIAQIVSKYCNLGLSSIAENHYKGNNRCLTYEEEKDLLEPFLEVANNGQMVDINEIRISYEKATGRSMENSHGQIYRVLKRHDWRKVMPRSKHPNKASDEVIET